MKRTRLRLRLRLRSKKDEKRDSSIKKNSHQRWRLFSLTLTFLFNWTVQRTEEIIQSQGRTVAILKVLRTTLGPRL
jgi:hypothetical protein